MFLSIKNATKWCNSQKNWTTQRRVTKLSILSIKFLSVLNLNLNLYLYLRNGPRFSRHWSGLFRSGKKFQVAQDMNLRSFFGIFSKPRIFGDRAKFRQFPIHFLCSKLICILCSVLIHLQIKIDSKHALLIKEVETLPMCHIECGVFDIIE